MPMFNPNYNVSYTIIYVIHISYKVKRLGLKNVNSLYQFLKNFKFT